MSDANKYFDKITGERLKFIVLLKSDTEASTSLAAPQRLWFQPAADLLRRQRYVSQTGPIEK